MKKISITLLITALGSLMLNAQIAFTEATSSQAPFVGVFLGSVSFADVNADGDQDVLITGDNNSGGQTARLYSNNGSGVFALQQGSGFLNVEFSTSAFADLDNDGDQDMIICGAISSADEEGRFFLNNGSGTFGSEIVLYDTRIGKVRALDLDNDGDQDLIITGEEASGSAVARAFYNNGSASFTAPFVAFEGVENSSWDYSDIDNDGDLDILMTGRTTSNVRTAKLYTNDSIGVFSLVAGTPFVGVEAGDVEFGDVDGDGDEDVVLTGLTTSGAKITNLYLHDGAGNFTLDNSNTFTPITRGDLEFADIDNDGDLDLLIAGLTDVGTSLTQFYVNNGSGVFAPICLPIAQVHNSSFEFTDVDDDGDLDFILTGINDSNVKLSKLYYNVTTPTIPFTWTGIISTDWNVGGNWDLGTVPTAADEAIIPATPIGGQFPIISSNTTLGRTDVVASAGIIVRPGIGVTLDQAITNSGDFVLESDATGDAYLDDYSSLCGSFNGLLTVERYVHGTSGNNQHMLSFPIQNTLAGSQIEISLNGPAGYSGLTGTDGVAVTPSATCDPNELGLGSNYGTIFEWDLATAAAATSCPEQAGWIVRSAGSMEKARGYSAYLEGSEEAFVIGLPNTGVLEFNNGLQAGVTTNAAIDNWNIVGNPYPTPMDYSEVLTGNTAISSIAQYIPSGPWSGTYTPYMPGDLIAIGQGFAARNGSGTTVDFETDDGMRSANNSTNWKSNEWFQSALTIELHGATYSDRSFVFFSNEATESFERMYDVEKRHSKAGQPSIFSLNQGVELAMQSFANAEDISRAIDLGVVAPEQGAFTFTAADLDKIPSEYEVYLIDNELNLTQDLRANPNYATSLDGGEMLDRFQIEIKKSTATSIQSLGINGLKVYPNPTNGVVNIELIEGLLDDINLLDLSGRRIASFQANQNTIDVSNISKGMYLLELTKGENTSVVKLYIN